MRKINARTLTKKKKREILDKYDEVCQYCCCELATEVDHILPWNFVHDNEDYNLVASCRVCNAVANDKVFKSFKAKRNYILTIRKKMLLEPIPIWTVEELEELGYKLRTTIEKSSIIANNDQHRLHLADLLNDKGYSVIISNNRVDKSPHIPAIFLTEELR